MTNKHRVKQFYYTCLDTDIPNRTRCLTIDEWYEEFYRVYKTDKINEIEFVYLFEDWHINNLVFKFEK